MPYSKKRMIFLTVFLGVMTAMAPLATDMYLPALPEMQLDFGITTSLAQLTLTMTMLGMALGQIFAGPVSDMRGRRPPLLVGMVVFALASLGCVLVSNIYLFLLLRFVQGFAGASGIVIARAIARDVCEGPALTRFFAILMMVNGLAPILAPVLGGQILLFTSWRGVFVVLVAVGICQFLASLIYRETLPPERRVRGLLRSVAKFPRLVKDRYFRGHCLLQCFVFGGFFVYIGGSSFAFQNVYGFTAQQFSFLFGGIGVGLLICGILPARLAGRVADEVLLRISQRVQFFGSLLLVAAFALNLPVYIVIPVLFVTIVPLSVISAASFSLALSRQGRNAGSASALLGFSQMVLGGIMMPVVGAFGGSTALPMGVIMAVFFGCGLLCYHRYIAAEQR